MRFNTLSQCLSGFDQSFYNGSLINKGTHWDKIWTAFCTNGIHDPGMNRVPHSAGEGRGHSAGTEVAPPYDRVRLAAPHDFRQKKRCRDFRRALINNSKSSTYFGIQSLSRDHSKGSRLKCRSTCSCFLFLINAYRNAPDDGHRCCL